MKKLIFGIAALCALVACSSDKDAATKQMLDYKQQWVEITSVIDAEAIDAEGFDAWYNTLSNIELRDVNKAIDQFDASYNEADHWYKNLSDDEQEAATEAAKTWEQENVALQHQVELFCTNILEVNLDELALIKVWAPKEEVKEEVATEEAPAEETAEKVEEDANAKPSQQQ
jgi:hypothetical protein